MYYQAYVCSALIKQKECVLTFVLSGTELAQLIHFWFLRFIIIEKMKLILCVYVCALCFTELRIYLSY